MPSAVARSGSCLPLYSAVNDGIVTGITETALSIKVPR